MHIANQNFFSDVIKLRWNYTGSRFTQSPMTDVFSKGKWFGHRDEKWSCDEENRNWSDTDSNQEMARVFVTSRN